MSSAGAARFVEAVNLADDFNLLSSVHNLETITVFAPIDAVMDAKRRRKVLQGTELTTPNDLGVYMAPEYLDFDSLVERASLIDSNITTLLPCANLTVDGRVGNEVLLKGPSGETVFVDGREGVAVDGRIMVHPIKVMLAVPEFCRLG